MVKTCEQATYNVLNGQRLTDELLATILCLTEQLLNARSLTPNVNDPTNLEALTPNQFFLGRSTIAIPYLPDAQKFQNDRKMFRVAQAHMDNVWSRWLKKNLPVHKIRFKWYEERPQLNEQDPVEIVDDWEKRGFYHLGWNGKKSAISGTIVLFDLVTSLLSQGLFFGLQSSGPVFLKSLGVFLFKRNATKRPENQCTKKHLKLSELEEPQLPPQ